MPIFRVKSVKIYTGQKNLHWRRRRQLSGMCIRWYGVSKGLVCLYILEKVEIWSGDTYAWHTDWQTSEDRATRTQLLSSIKHKLSHAIWHHSLVFYCFMYILHWNIILGINHFFSVSSQFCTYFVAMSKGVWPLLWCFLHFINTQRSLFFHEVLNVL